MSSKVSVSRVSLTYAKALFDAYKDEPLDDFLVIKKTMEQNDLELYKAVSSPLLPQDSKVNIITGIFKGRVRDYMYNYLLMLIERRRIELVLDIHIAYVDLVNAFKGIVCGDIRIPGYASKDDEKNISATVSQIFGSTVDLSFVKDDSVIAGFQGMAGGKFLDYSVLGHLKQLENELK